MESGKTPDAGKDPMEVGAFAMPKFDNQDFDFDQKDYQLKLIQQMMFLGTKELAYKLSRYIQPRQGISHEEMVSRISADVALTLAIAMGRLKAPEDIPADWDTQLEQATALANEAVDGLPDEQINELGANVQRFASMDIASKIGKIFGPNVQIFEIGPDGSMRHPGDLG